MQDQMKKGLIVATILWVITVISLQGYFKLSIGEATFETGVVSLFLGTFLTVLFNVLLKKLSDKG